LAALPQLSLLSQDRGGAPPPSEDPPSEAKVPTEEAKEAKAKAAPRPAAGRGGGRGEAGQKTGFAFNKPQGRGSGARGAPAAPPPTTQAEPPGKQLLAMLAGKGPAPVVLRPSPVPPPRSAQVGAPLEGAAALWAQLAGGAAASPRAGGVEAGKAILQMVQPNMF
jgi:hypothetical protein